MQLAIEASQLTFSYPNANTPTLQIEQLALPIGHKLFVEGPSGSGKSTLLSLLVSITPVQSGSLKILGEDMAKLSGRARDAFRAEHIGYVFQQFNLLPYLSVLENVQIADTFRHKKLAARQGKERAMQLLSALQIPQEAFSKSGIELSVGQQQRVAIARALYAKPDILIADEPTSALDHANAAAFMQLLLKQVNEQGTTLVYVSHDESLRLNFDQMVRLRSPGGAQ
ncbi:ABC transporter ATP-binding protein [Pseudobowmanella zhangzhouensis]|uniref:ABC transporter ATP-binding protein n=1 Tax=Pseudobowmanella zhangzhouensis TaxID=1537679 RepID=UPI003619ADD7